MPSPQQQWPQVSVKTKKDQKKKVLAFLLSLRSGITVSSDSPFPKTDLKESQRASEEEEEIDEELQLDSQETKVAASPLARHDDIPPCYHYQLLDFKILEKLKAAVSNYGPTAPFTLALLESSTEGWLTPNKFSHRARAALTGSGFVLLKSKVAEMAKEIKIKNHLVSKRPEIQVWYLA